MTLHLMSWRDTENPGRYRKRGRRICRVPCSTASFRQIVLCPSLDETADWPDLWCSGCADRRNRIRQKTGDCSHSLQLRPQLRSRVSDLAKRLLNESKRNVVLPRKWNLRI